MPYLHDDPNLPRRNPFVGGLEAAPDPAPPTVMQRAFAAAGHPATPRVSTPDPDEMVNFWLGGW